MWYNTQGLRAARSRCHPIPEGEGKEWGYWSPAKSWIHRRGAACQNCHVAGTRGIHACPQLLLPSSHWPTLARSLRARSLSAICRSQPSGTEQSKEEPMIYPCGKWGMTSTIIQLGFLFLKMFTSPFVNLSLPHTV